MFFTSRESLTLFFFLYFLYFAVNTADSTNTENTSALWSCNRWGQNPRTPLHCHHRRHTFGGDGNGAFVVSGLAGVFSLILSPDPCYCQGSLDPLLMNLETLAGLDLCFVPAPHHPPFGMTHITGQSDAASNLCINSFKLFDKLHWDFWDPEGGKMRRKEKDNKCTLRN